MFNWLLATNRFLFWAVTPITVHGRLPTRITCPSGSMFGPNRRLRVLWSITTTWAWRRASSALNTMPAANGMLRTWK
ncbi:hypothetical protein D3C78_1717550 [compost metagenome]